jgi:hypothetical protein
MPFGFTSEVSTVPRAAWTFDARLAERRAATPTALPLPLLKGEGRAGGETVALGAAEAAPITDLVVGARKATEDFRLLPADDPSEEGKTLKARTGTGMPDRRPDIFPPAVRGGREVRVRTETGILDGPSGASFPEMRTLANFTATGRGADISIVVWRKEKKEGGKVRTKATTGFRKSLKAEEKRCLVEVVDG